MGNFMPGPVLIIEDDPDIAEVLRYSLEISSAWAMPLPDVITLTPCGLSNASLPRLSLWTTSPCNNQLAVCKPMCGCGATSIGLDSLKECGPKRSRKHHAPTSRFCRTGSALRICSVPRLVSCAGNLSNTDP